MPSKKPAARIGSAKSREKVEKQAPQARAQAALSLAARWAKNARERHASPWPPEVAELAETAKSDPVVAQSLFDALAADAPASAASFFEGVSVSALWASRPTLARTRQAVAQNAPFLSILDTRGQIDWGNRDAWISALQRAFDASAGVASASIDGDVETHSPMEGAARCFSRLRPFNEPEAVRLAGGLARCVAHSERRLASDMASTHMLGRGRWRAAEQAGLWDEAAMDAQLSLALTALPQNALLWGVIFETSAQTAPEPQKLAPALRALAEQITEPVLARAWALSRFNDGFKEEARAAGVFWPQGHAWLREEAARAMALGGAGASLARAQEFARSPGLLAAERWLQVADRLAFAKTDYPPAHAFAAAALGAALREQANPEDWMRSARKTWRQALRPVQEEMQSRSEFSMGVSPDTLAALATLWGGAPKSWRSEPAAIWARKRFTGESLALAEQAELAWEALSAKEKAETENVARAAEIALAPDSEEPKKESRPAARGPRRM